MFMLNKKAIMLYMLALVMLLAACSGGTNAPSAGGGSATPAASATSTPAPTPTPAETVQKVELRMAWWGSEERHDMTLRAIELFEAQNPGVTITGEYSGFDGYFDKLNTQIAAGNAPDLIQMGGNVGEYIQKNALLDISPYEGDLIRMDDFNRALVKDATIDGQLYGLPLGVSSSGLLYNAGMFEKAGVAIPGDDWSYDDFKNIAIQISQNLGKGYYGSYDLSNDASSVTTYLYSIGKELYKDGERHFDKQDMVDWFAMWDEMRKAGAIVPPDLQVANPPSAIDKSLIVKGQVAIQSAAASQIYGYQELTTDRLGLIVNPNGPAGTGLIPPITGQFITGYKNTKHPEIVAKFMDFMVNDPEAGLILGSNRGVPPAGKVRDALAATSTPVDKVLYDYVSVVSSIAPPDRNYQQFPLDNEYIKLLQLTGEKIAFGATSIDAAVDEFMTEVDKLLVKAKAN